MSSQIAKVRKTEVTVPNVSGDGEIIFEIKGIGGADFIDFSGLYAAKEYGRAYRSVISAGLVRVVSGLDDEKGNTFNVRTGDVVSFLSSNQTRELGLAILAHSRLDDDAKKD